MKCKLSIARSILAQYQVGTWLGGIRSIFTQAQFYLGMVQFGMVAVLAYDGSIGHQLKIWMPWISFWWYASVLVVAYLCLMAFEWKVVYPSIVALSNQQVYKHDNPMVADLQQIKRDIDLIKRELKIEDMK